MRDSNAVRQRAFRQRRKEAEAARAAAVRAPGASEVSRTEWEQAFVETAEERRPGADAPPGSGDRPGKRPGSVPRQAITREWCMDQLRLYALDPSLATVGSVAAIKLLLTEIPKGNAPLDNVPLAVVKNVVRVQRPSDKALDGMLEERAAEQRRRDAEDTRRVPHSEVAEGTFAGEEEAEVVALDDALERQELQDFEQGDEERSESDG